MLLKTDFKVQFGGKELNKIPNDQQALNSTLSAENQVLQSTYPSTELGTGVGGG